MVGSASVPFVLPDALLQTGHHGRGITRCLDSWPVFMSRIRTAPIKLDVGNPCCRIVWIAVVNREINTGWESGRETRPAPSFGFDADAALMRADAQYPQPFAACNERGPITT